MTQRQVSTVHTPRSGAVLGVVAMPVVVQRLAPGSGQFRQLWLLFSGGGTAAGGGMPDDAGWGWRDNTLEGGNVAVVD